MCPASQPAPTVPPGKLRRVHMLRPKLLARNSSWVPARGGLNPTSTSSMRDLSHRFHLGVRVDCHRGRTPRPETIMSPQLVGAAARSTVRSSHGSLRSSTPVETGGLARMWSDCGTAGRRYRRAPIGTRWLTPGDDLVAVLEAHLPDRRTGDTVVVSEKVAVLLLGRASPKESVRSGRLPRLLARLLPRRTSQLEPREAEWLCRCLERALGTGVAIVARGRSVRATSPLSLPASGLAQILSDDPLGRGLDATPFVLVRPAPERRAAR